MLWGNGDHGSLGSQWRTAVCPAVSNYSLQTIACGGALTVFLTVFEIGDESDDCLKTLQVEGLTNCPPSTDDGRANTAGLRDFGRLVYWRVSITQRYQKQTTLNLVPRLTMESTEQVQQAMLLTKQEKLESNILTNIKFTPTHVIDLDGFLCDTYVRMCPKPVDYFNRSDLVRIFNLITKEIYGNSDDSPVVEGYGSFVMDMFTNESNLDLSINFHDSIEVSREEKIYTLQKFKNKLHSIERKGGVTRIQSIMGVKVPIIKVTDRGTGIECDFSVNNWDGIAKSQIIHAISAIDERFRKLCFLMKSWAKAHDINSSKDGTLNYLSIILLVAFHFQTCNPPILPPFSILLRDGADLVSVTNIVKTYFNYGKRNKESLAKLFITLIVKLASVESLWKQGFCASVYEGSWILKSWNHPCSLRVEDFMDRSQNVARAVRTGEVETIYKCIHKSLSYLCQFRNDQIQGTELMDFLFGTRTLGVGRSSNNNRNNLPSLENICLDKKISFLVAIGKNLLRDSEGNFSAQYLQGKELQGRGLMQQSLGNVAHNAHASFPPSVSYQPPLPASSSNIEVHHGLGAVPYPFTSQPIVSPSVQSDLVSPQTSRGGVQSLHQETVARNPRGGSFPPSSVKPLLPPKKRPLLPPKKRSHHRI